MAQAGNALYANTTLIPTSFYLGIMFILTLSHVIVRITQAVTQHFYTLSIESGRSIFLLTAFLVSALAAIVRLVLHTYS